MSAAEKIPWTELALTAKDCGELWHVTPEHFLAKIACLPGFPERLSNKPATWKAGEIIDWRDRNRAKRRRRT
ncbi:MAG TPA: hypothetical protein VFS82_01385 [Lysobacter sp.]|nr:hypothetical protein [Lysobacter sp.]